LTISFLIILGIIVSFSFGLTTVSAQENKTLDLGISVEADEELIENLTPILPYLGIIVVGIIVGIVVIIKKSNRNDEDFEDEEFEDDSPESYFETPKFQEIHTQTDPDNVNALDPEYLIQNKVRMISKLQENKIGDNGKLEKIKKDLIDYGTFTKEDNEYLEEQFKEYEKITESKDE